MVADAYERMAFHDAAHATIAISSRGNLYLQETAPWTAFKKVCCCAVKKHAGQKCAEQRMGAIFWAAWLRYADSNRASAHTTGRLAARVLCIAKRQ